MAGAVFQSFEDRADGRQGPARLAALRAELAKLGVDGFLVPRADEHQGENVPASEERLAWLTGFTGSWGSAVTLADRAAIFVDGRYGLQARAQVDGVAFAVVDVLETSVEAWLERNLKSGEKLGYDPRLVTPEALKRHEAAAAKADATLVPLEPNPIDQVWTDRPRRPNATIVAHDLAFAGESAAAKLFRVREALEKERCDGLFLSDPHDVAWLFNIRGADIGHTPIALVYAYVPREGAAKLFAWPDRLEPAAAAALAGQVDLEAPLALATMLKAAAEGGRRIRCDQASVGVVWTRLIEQAGGKAELGVSPVVKLKAVKNATEIEGIRAAHRRDGAAVSRFLAWFAREAPTGKLTEIDAVEALEGFRRETNVLVDVSFPTISGSGPNGAIVHYRVTKASNRSIGPGELFLVDSGAQYRDGTTDITRTVAVGTAGATERDRFTRVLKGHIAVATCVFPKNTPGVQIDAFARRALWDAGEDFDHGTGHGVGAFLSVHEGPAGMGKRAIAPLEAGMVLSNEPGFYREGAFGIRIENLLLVEERAVVGGSRPMLGFETLTLAPIDTALIEPALMTEAEIAWLDAYHARVRETLAPGLDAATRAWLAEATRAVGARGV